MFKFFRRIRQQLLSKNRFGKYLLYAVGEIVLVVVGILIALQVNNWNTNRINQQKEVNILSELREEYQGKLKELNQKVNLRNLIINACGELFSYINEKQYNISADSITKYASLTIIPATFDASNSVTEELLSTGNLYLIQNTELRKLITNWESELAKMTEEEQIIMSTIIHNYTPYVAKNLSHKNIAISLLDQNNAALKYIWKSSHNSEAIEKSRFKIDIENLLNDIEFENHLSYIWSASISANVQSESLRNQINKVFELIDTELERSK